jgi:hydroxyacylglutathione hydrolase
MFSKTLPTSRIAPNVFAVKTRFVNFYIYSKDGFALCVDTGMKIHNLSKELQKINLTLKDISHVFLTHTDSDHVGGITAFSDAKLYISELEEQIINGQTKRSPLIRNAPIRRDYTKLKDNQSVFVGPIEVLAISTSGHTTGSMSYLINRNLLFVGDTIYLKKGKATTGIRLFNMDIGIQTQSIKKLAQLQDISLLFTGHSGMTDRFRDAIGD